MRRLYVKIGYVCFCHSNDVNPSFYFDIFWDLFLCWAWTMFNEHGSYLNPTSVSIIRCWVAKMLAEIYGFAYQFFMKVLFGNQLNQIYETWESLWVHLINYRDLLDVSNKKWTLGRWILTYLHKFRKSLGGHSNFFGESYSWNIVNVQININRLGFI